jgi:hypothetical protein
LYELFTLEISEPHVVVEVEIPCASVVNMTLHRFLSFVRGYIQKRGDGSGRVTSGEPSGMFSANLFACRTLRVAHAWELSDSLGGILARADEGRDDNILEQVGSVAAELDHIVCRTRSVKLCLATASWWIFAYTRSLASIATILSPVYKVNHSEA